MDNHFFKSLEIRNFRGIRKSEINDFARINLFVGENNCGKTTVLESLFLLAGISDPNWIITIQNLRKIFLTEPEDIRDLFFERNHENNFHLKGVQAVGNRGLTVKPLYGNFHTDQTGGEVAAAANGDEGKHISKTKIMGPEADSSLSGLEYEFFVADKKNRKLKRYNRSITAQWVAFDQPAKFQSSPRKTYEESSFKGFMFIKQGDEYDPVFVDRILEAKQKDLLLEALRIVEPKILDIKVGPTKLVSVDIGYSSFIPVNLLGDGLIHMMKVVCAVPHTKDGILMIDEIGNGLHISCLKRLWKVLIEQSKKFDTQIFMTTHSKDVIESLVKLYEQEGLLFSEDEDTVACFYLDKNARDQVKGYRYSPEQIMQALQSGTDIRH